MASTPGDLSGISIAGPGDVNGDGIDDLLIGASGASPRDTQMAGEAYLLLGRDGEFPAVIELVDLLPENGGDGSMGVVFEGIDGDGFPRFGDAAGETVSALGDVNGDGLDDFLIGAPEADPRLSDSAGEAYVLFGTGAGFAPRVELSSLAPENGGDGSAGFVIGGSFVADRIAGGGAAGAAGDVNADGVDDLIVGAAGRAYVLFGRTTGFEPVIFPARLPGGDGSTGFLIIGGANDGVGNAVSHAGDVNADGVSDLIVGAVQHRQGGFASIGQAYVVFGNVQFNAVVPVNQLDP